MIKRIKDFFSKKQVKPSADEKFKNAILIIQAFQLKYINNYSGMVISTVGKDYCSVFVHSEDGVVLYLDIKKTSDGFGFSVNKMENDERLIALISLLKQKQK
ncbi:MAG: hypothetical protein ACRDD8_13190 [Bacteroidales bacterium]